MNLDPLTEEELVSAPRPHLQTIRNPIVPVPATAPTLDFKHPDHGLPRHTWPYFNAEGLVGFVARFEDGLGGKTFLSLMYCSDGDRTRWLACDFPAPRPLYNWPELKAKPADPVLIVSGEANVDAAKILFPQHVSVCCPYGLSSIEKADWSDLKDREVLILPPNDERKSKFIDVSGLCAYKAGSRDVRVLDPDMFANTIWHESIQQRREFDVPQWDARQALSEGWVAETIARRIAESGALPVIPKPLIFDSYGRPTFRMSERGVEGLHQKKLLKVQN